MGNVTRDPRRRAHLPLLLVMVLVLAACPQGSGEPVPPLLGNAAAAVALPPPGGDPDLTAAVGRIAGGYSIDNDGDFTYSISLDLPPGRQDVRPSLGLSYSSSTGNGVLGMGWSLTGLSVIGECPMTLDQDGIHGSGGGGATCLDGLRLARVPGGNGAPKEWRTIPDTHVRVAEAVEGEGIHQQSCGYVVYRPGGTVARYGCTEDSVETNAGAPKSWSLSQVFDRHGNYWRVTYRMEDEPYDTHTVLGPLTIDYTGNADTGLAPTKRVRFEYLDNRIDTLFNHQAKLLPVNARLAAIGIGILDGEDFDVTREYRLEYEATGSTKRSRLTSLTECAVGDTAQCKPPTLFTWQVGNEGLRAAVATPRLGPAINGECMRPYWADFNGDGRDDIAWSHSSACGSGFFVTLAAGTTLAESSSAQSMTDTKLPLIPLDIDNDRRTDVAMMSESTPAIVIYRNFVDGVFTSQASTPIYGTEVAQALGADINGDGLTDLVTCEETDESHDYEGHSYAVKARWIYYRNRGNGTLAAPVAANYSAEIGQPPFPIICRPGHGVVVDDDQQNGEKSIYGFAARAAHPDYHDHDLPFHLSNNSFDDFLGSLNADYAGPNTVLDELDKPRLNVVGWADGHVDSVRWHGADWQARMVRRGGLDHAVIEGLQVDDDMARSLPIDFNGDGRDDLLLPIVTSSAGPKKKGVWKVVRNVMDDGEVQFTAPDSVGLSTYWEDSSDPLAKAQPALVVDLDGDGQHDLVRTVPGAGGVHYWHVSLHQKARVGATPAEGPPDLLRHVVDGYGAWVKVAYKPMTDPAVYQVNDTCVYPASCVMSTRPLAYQVDADDGAGGSNLTTYKYFDGRYDRWSRRWLGFAKIESLSTATGTRRRTLTFDNQTNTYGASPTADSTSPATAYRGFPFAGLIKQDKVEVLEIATATEHETRTDNVWVLRAASAGTSAPLQNYAVELQSETQRTYDLLYSKDPIRTVQTIYDRDKYGNQNAVTRKYTKPGSAPEVITTTYDWDRDEASWAFAPSGRTDVHQAADGRKVTRYLDIDNEHSSCSSCLTAAVIQGYRPSAVIRDADTFLQGMTEAYEYDAYGNITDISHIGPSSTRITTVIFDAEHTFPVEITNPLAQTAHLTWDPMLGKPVLSESPYGVKLWMKHDSFGRLIWRQSEDRDGNASGDEVELTYAMAPGSTRLLTTVVSADGRQATTEHDGFERPIAAETSGVDQDVQQLATYDRFGRLARVSKAVPVGATVKEGQRYLYDGIGRVRKRRLIDASVDWGDDPGPGQSIVFEQAYSGLTETHYDPEGNRTDYQVDALGQIVRVTDDVGTAFCYRYAPFGGIDRVAKGCEKPPWQELVEYERDRWGRVTSVIDPSGVGNRSYTYNAFGEPWTSTDGNGVVTTLTHDDLGRLVSLENADLFHEWLYDQLPPSGALPAGGPPAPGMLVGTVGATGHVREHDYDALGRLSTTLTRVGNEVFEVHRTYDASGHLEDIDYPSPGPGAAFGVRHVYDGVGNLRAVLHKQSGLALWTLQAADADGQPLLEGYGNGRSTVREFDPTTGAQLSVRTGTIAGGVLGSQIQNLSSTWTKNGNLHARTDHLHGQTETFFYDTLDRLTGSEVERQQEITTTPTISYDRFGNITTHPTLGTIVSGPGGRALSLNGSAWHVYDDNGNVLSAPDLTVDWNTLNRPTLITTGGEQVHLEYDADGAEIVRESNDGELTIRIDGGYERTSRQGSIENKYHVAAGGRVVAMARIKTAAPNLVEWSYLHNDTLGSTHVVSNQAGDAIQLISTDAWGVHRGPNWADPDDPGGVLGGVDTSAYQEVNVGYTGHRAQLDGGLVNMGARHYAAQASRFLRADPFIHDAYDTQAYSRYSYARNNPTTNTDPSGRFLSFGGGGVAYCGIFNGIPVVGGLFGLTVGLFDLLSPSSQDMEAGDAAGTRRSASTADARQSASYASREGGPAVATRPSRGAMTAGTDAQAYGVRMWSPKHGPMASQEHWNGAGRQVMPVMAAQAWYSVFEDPEQVGWAIPKPGTGGDVMGIFDMEGNLLGEDIDASESEGHLYVQAALMLTPIRMPAAALRGATAAERIVASGASAEASGIAGGAAGHAAADAVAARVALGGPESVAWVLPQLPKALGGGTRNVHVYFGVGVDGERIYVGITNDIVRRQAAHSSRMVGLEEVTTHAVTRGEARAIEQALIERFRATFLNKINSISPRHKWQQDAINWGESWLRARGI